MVVKKVDINNKIANNIKNIIKSKFKTVKDASVAGGWGEKYLTNMISKIKNAGNYPSIPQLLEIATLCECDLKDFFE